MPTNLSKCLAFVLLFISAATAQSSISRSEPSFSGSLTASAASPSASASSSTFSYPYPPAYGESSYYSSDSGPTPSTIGLAVGLSLGLTLLLLLGLFLCIRRRRQHKMMVIGLEGANNADLGKRCDVLEKQVEVLREQLDGFMARELDKDFNGSGKAVPGSQAGVYANEKEGLRVSMDSGKGKRPPKYLD
ncbi:hypothetical protein R3P38DRAFT_1294849 [Favolaschia claudopus]|uniref:Uncharacterized protein n=1 Tax=Favolaschia claudopus TaxID=2862362 RepID=A0AAW0AX90_9AGAR